MNDKLKNFLQKVDFEQIAKQLSEDIANRVIELHDFYNRPRFREIIELIKQELETKEQINDDAYSEFVFKNVNNNEFIKVFGVLFANQITGLPIKKHECEFETEYVEFENLYFIEMHGQGTAYIVRKQLWD
jgi:hypothetical protein